MPLANLVTHILLFVHFSIFFKRHFIEFLHGILQLFFLFQFSFHILRFGFRIYSTLRLVLVGSTRPNTYRRITPKPRLLSCDSSAVRLSDSIAFHALIGS